jgi:hypothetical protein
MALRSISRARTLKTASVSVFPHDVRHVNAEHGNRRPWKAQPELQKGCNYWVGWGRNRGENSNSLSAVPLRV